MASKLCVTVENNLLTDTTTSSGKRLRGHGSQHVAWLDASEVDADTTLNVKLQHSPDGQKWVDLVTFTQLVGVDGHEAKQISSGVFECVRAISTLAGTTKKARILCQLFHADS